MRALARRGNEVMLASLWTNESEHQALETIAEYGVRVLSRRISKRRSLVNCLRTLPTHLPLQSAYSWQPELMRDVEQLAHAHAFDVAHVEHVRAVRYGMFLKRSLASENGEASTRLPIVWDSVDCISHLYRQASRQSRCLKGRLMGALDAARTEKLEAVAARTFDLILLTSMLDAEALTKVCSTYGDLRPSNLRVLCNGVDLEYFSPDYTPREPATLVYTGKMSYHANITAARHLVRDIMPFVWSSMPEVSLQIVGKDPPAGVRELGDDRIIGTAGRPRVAVTGTVDDIRRFLRSATAAVAPIPYGAGVQNKVLEAMACGTPVVGSPVAVSALRVKPGINVLVGDTAESFAAQIKAMLANRQLRDRLGAAGRRYVEQHHSWDVAAAHLEGLYQEACRSRPFEACVRRAS